MAMRLDICPEPGWLHVAASGRFSLGEAKRTFIEMLEAIAHHRSDRVLLDGRALKGKPEFIERFYYGEYAAERVLRLTTDGGLPMPQFAYVLKEPVLDPGRFGETVAVNRGMNIRVFSEPGEALAWLGVGRDAVDTGRPVP
jgi:hypothetical protein